MASNEPAAQVGWSRSAIVHNRNLAVDDWRAMGTGRTRARARIFITAAVVAGIGVATVWSLQCSIASESEKIGDTVTACDPANYPAATIDVDAEITADRLSTPRLTTTTTVHLPHSWYASNDLLDDPGTIAYRSAVRCLFGDLGTETAVSRDQPPPVEMTTGDVVVTDTAWFDLTKPGKTTLGLVDLEAQDNGDWFLSVNSRWGLTQATTWNITVAAPDSWLAGASPWPEPANAKSDRLSWYFGTTAPMAETTMTTVSLHPPAGSEIIIWEGTTWGRIVGWILFDWPQTTAFSVLVLLFIRWARKQRLNPGERITDSANNARRVTLPLLVFQLAVLGIDITWITLDALGQQVPDWANAAWAVDIAVCTFALLFAWRCWIRGSVLLLLTAGFAAILVVVPLLSGDLAFENADPVRAVVLSTLETSLTFLVTVLVAASLLNAVRVLFHSLRKATTPFWLWASASLVAASLLFEGFWLTGHNFDLQQWLADSAPATGALQSTFRYSLWGLLSDRQWIFLLLPAIATLAVTRDYLRRTTTSERKPLMTIASLLIALGPAVWYSSYAGFSLPVWIAVVATFRLLCNTKTPVLDLKLVSGEPIRSWVARHGPAAVETHAKAWLSRRGRGSATAQLLPRRVTPVDVAFALGPGKTPHGNLKVAVRAALWPGAVAGFALCFLRDFVRTDYSGTINQSLVVLWLQDLSWESLKWIFAAAALGILWQHLPGKRGPVKVLPLIAGVGVGPLLAFAAPSVLGGDLSFDSLIELATFTVVITLVGWRMDMRVLRNLDSQRYSTWKESLAIYGVGNMSSRITTSLAPLTAVVTIVFTLIAGPDTATKTESKQEPSTGSSGQVLIPPGH
ncbi:DUF6185 family protein [Amycolatopsis mediterranei]|uniref:DUF6185 family protein n=1 Tax=Amycolatopsis mediterranei TaxID=33910 RepID=UPI003422BD3D